MPHMSPIFWMLFPMMALMILYLLMVLENYMVLKPLFLNKFKFMVNKKMFW